MTDLLESARRALAALDDLIANTNDPGVEALGARHELSVALINTGIAPSPHRILTENEHSAAWHAIEGTADEEGADPGTVLNAVLRALGIDPPGSEAAPAAPDCQCIPASPMAPRVYCDACLPAASPTP